MGNKHAKQDCVHSLSTYDRLIYLINGYARYHIHYISNDILLMLKHYIGDDILIMSMTEIKKMKKLLNNQLKINMKSIDQISKSIKRLESETAKAMKEIQMLTKEGETKIVKRIACGIAKWKKIRWKFNKMKRKLLQMNNKIMKNKIKTEGQFNKEMDEILNMYFRISRNITLNELFESMPVEAKLRFENRECMSDDMEIICDSLDREMEIHNREMEIICDSLEPKTSDDYNREMEIHNREMEEMKQRLRNLT
eukprot:269670_1